ncbi:pentapeptide repeat-containing protein [Pleurocapsa sp. FMAR1]|uniref:pentapeptide repeat-containing protein n=1 Tax=Pleurocapsa sp. FMAR1 TaxID=3040204 RepID=UPI0029C8C342|nr:pentapeptide repeat-containing protein [Pleurocapsa sp. FMAR1]
MITLEEILNRYLAGERNFSQIKIRLGELANQDLSNINLSDASLSQVSLVGCNLSNANLSKANLPGSNLEGVNLSDADMSQTNFCVGESKDYAQIMTSIENSWTGIWKNLPTETATQAKEQMYAQMSQQLPEFLFPVSLKRANLERANLTQADLRRTYLNDANLQGTDLTNANLSEADLRNANLSNANLTGVKFGRVNLSQTNLTGAKIDRGSLKNALLNWTIMPDGSLHGNPALELINSKINPLQRKAWFPITVKQDGDLTTSKFAGKPWLNADESFPCCGCCNNWMRFFFQLNLEQVPNNIKGEFGKGLLQFFYCVDCDDWQPFSESHLVRIIEPQGETAEYELPHFQDNWSDDSLVKKSNGKFPARIIVNWKETTDYPDWIDAESTGVTLNDEQFKTFLSGGNQEELEDFSHLSDFQKEYSLRSQRSEIVHHIMDEASMLPLERDKLSGYPRWVQDPEYPNCPICDHSMDRLIFEFASDDNIPYLWGDVGTGYFLQCPEHKKQVTFLWQCG